MAHRIRARVGAGGVRAIAYGRAHAATTSSAAKNGASHEVGEVRVWVGVVGVVGVVVFILVVVARRWRRSPTPAWPDGDLVLLQGHQLLQVHCVAGRALAGTHQLHVRVVNLREEKTVLGQGGGGGGEGLRGWW